MAFFFNRSCLLLNIHKLFGRKNIWVKLMRAKVIIIDDNDIIRNLLQELLSRKGYQTIVSADGKSALKLIKKNKPEFAIVDLILPDISGIDVLKSIRKISPITESIVITGHSSFEMTKEVLDSHAAPVGFLEKPLDVSQLLAILKEAFEQRENFFAIQKNLEELEQMNYQLEFFNSIICRDIEMMNDSLSKAIKLISPDSLSKEQTKGLQLLKLIYQNNKRLNHSLKKMHLISTIQPKTFTKVDVATIIKSSLNLIQQNYTEEIIPINHQDFPEGKFFAKGTINGLHELFSELFFSLVMPTIPVKSEMDIKIRESNNLTNSKGENIRTIEIEINITTKREDFEEEIQLSEFESQNYGLGFFLVKKLIDVYNGKIFLEDSKKNGKTITTFIIFLPADN
ncbi:MAG: response regulator [Candidatus Heimdallarchaeota archaeon]|nr:response regulator [Candidatus Heimdallarchaeota archaeon]